MQAHSQVSNPYVDCDAVSHLKMFFGRQQEVQILYGAISKRQSVSIVGSRHIGKSSLLKFLGDPELQGRYGHDFQRFLFVVTDWRAYLQRTREDFFHRICEHILTQSQGRIELHLPAYPGEDRFVKLLEDIRRAGFFLVLLMDAFDRVTSNPEFDTRFFSFLRSLAGVSDLVSYVTATRKPLHMVCHSLEVASSPFFNIFLPCSLGAFTPDEARELITLPAEQAHCPFTPAEVTWLFEHAGLHPFFLQVACRHLLIAKSQQPTGNASLMRVHWAIYQELLPHIDVLWEELEEHQQEQLRQGMLHHVQTSQALLEFSGSSLFRARIRSLAQDNLTRLTMEDIHVALEHLEDTDFLAQCQLSKLQSISEQINTSEDGPTNKRGILVRHLLNKAFGQMKPGDTRGDSALEWRHYNIFWYRYFKYHLPNPQIAARLSVSIRQFYREQEKALQRLLKEVLDIEAQTLQQLE